MLAVCFSELHVERFRLAPSLRRIATFPISPRLTYSLLSPFPPITKPIFSIANNGFLMGTRDCDRHGSLAAV
jgi:hypothetical protein